MTWCWPESTPTETYLDTGNRGLFENAAEPLVLHPDASRHRPGGPGRALLRTVAGRCRVGRADLAPAGRPRAPRGFGAPAAPVLTRDPELAVRVDGRLFRPAGIDAGRHVFVLPTVDGPVRLVSRATAPHAIRPWIARPAAAWRVVSRRDGPSRRRRSASSRPTIRPWGTAGSRRAERCRDRAAGPMGMRRFRLNRAALAVLEVAVDVLPAYALERPDATAFRTAA